LRLKIFHKLRTVSLNSEYKLRTIEAKNPS